MIMRIAGFARPLPLLTNAAALVLVLWIAIALVGPLVAPYSEAAFAHDDSFLPPGTAGLLGSDTLGRDILSRLLFGARRTLALSFLAATIAMTAGVAFGFTAALLQGKVDFVLSRLDDTALSLPTTMLALVVISGLGISTAVLVITVGLIEATRVFRVARAIATDICSAEYIDVARVRGEHAGWIIFREILPNAISPLFVEGGIRFTYSMLLLSALSFLGLGIQPPEADWGAMVRENMAGLLLGSTAPLIPAAAIASVTISVNVIMDSIITRNRIEYFEHLRNT